MYISFFLCGFMVNSYFTENLIHRNYVFFKCTQLQALYFIAQRLFLLQKYERLFDDTENIYE